MILCSGKVAFDIDAKLESSELSSRIKVVRIEELAPFPTDRVRAQLSSTHEQQVFWVQEESMNQGAF